MWEVVDMRPLVEEGSVGMSPSNIVKTSSKSQLTVRELDVPISKDYKNSKLDNFVYFMMQAYAGSF